MKNDIQGRDHGNIKIEMKKRYPWSNIELLFTRH
jgi:hypothetical protein